MNMRIKTLGLLLVITISLSAQKKGFPIEKQEAVKRVLKKYIDFGVPGLSLAVYNEQMGLWTYAEGFANLENKTALTTEHLHYLQSISKTYMAVVILQLYEKGKLKLEDPIVQYLDHPWLTSIKDTEKITLKMLLNHTSGLPEYSTEPLLVSRIIQDPLTILTVPEMLSYIEGKSLDFEPGSTYSYRNTNFAFLALIADKITGNHITYMEKELFEKLKLKSTYVLSKDNIDLDLNLVDAYWDVLQEALPTNISKLQRANVSSMKGDDGMVTSSEDAILFFKGLISGKLLRPKTLELMQEWVLSDEGEQKYGLGLTFYDLETTYGVGHSGGGIGAGCVLIYLPDLASIVFIATNFNTMMESPIRKKAENLQMDILTALFM
ncbi:serine hydrolase [Ulvibacterium sp.]|uniref:serine hydrolase domain-containing protein n=1 Tax=Ulvibacterium sp. TaxID=2665914 RepID=UPI00261F9DBF|nr:serine hydrolase domain-containing protein [Ulvibacterium sp.]